MTWKKLKPSEELIKYLNSGKGRLKEKFEEEGIDTEKIKKYLKVFIEWYNGHTSSEYLPSYSPASYDLIEYYTKTEYDLPKLTQKEIQEIIKEIKDIRKKDKYFKDTGIFISCLINECYPGKEIEIEVNYPFDHLGLNNEKDLIIYGDVGDYVGQYMKGGIITIEGNAESYVGDQMESGEIHLNGDYGSISNNIYGGEICHKGKLIYKDGKKVG